jgi:hypothetical protein
LKRQEAAPNAVPRTLAVVRALRVKPTAALGALLPEILPQRILGAEHA